jgi:YVTN family beta-propeller protein
VANYGSDTVTPVSIRKGSVRAGRPTPVGQAPDALAVTPDSETVLAVGGDSETVTPLTPVTTPGNGWPGGSSLRTGAPVPVGYSPTAIAVAASGRTAFVVNTISGTLTPVTVQTGQTGRALPVGQYSYPTAIDLAPSGALAVVIDSYGDQITLVNTSTHREIRRIDVGSYPVATVIAP